MAAHVLFNTDAEQSNLIMTIETSSVVISVYELPYDVGVLSPLFVEVSSDQVMALVPGAMLDLAPTAVAFYGPDAVFEIVRQLCGVVCKAYAAEFEDETILAEIDTDVLVEEGLI